MLRSDIEIAVAQLSPVWELIEDNNPSNTVMGWRDWLWGD